MAEQREQGVISTTNVDCMEAILRGHTSNESVAA